MVQFEVKGQLRGGKDHIQTRRDGRRYPLKAFVVWRGDVLLQIKQAFREQARPIPHFTVPLSIEVSYFPSDNRKRNITAMLDGLFHVFEVIGLVEHDELFENCDWKNCGIDRENPRAMIIIRTMGRG